MSEAQQPAKPVGALKALQTEFLAGLATYLTLSYIFILNPIQLSRTGIDISAAFAATVFSAFISTMLMGLWARLPFAIAPAPSLTTFFVSYVCLTLGLPWQGALAAVVVSGVLSLLMTWASIRGRLIESVPPALQIGVLFSICGFLVANGFNQAGLVTYENGFINLQSLSVTDGKFTGAAILASGLLVTLVFRSRFFNFSGAPLFGVLVAAALAGYLGVQSVSQAKFSTEMLSSVSK